jgi:hypothetical protein
LVGDTVVRVAGVGLLVEDNVGNHIGPVVIGTVGSMELNSIGG